MKKIVLVLTLAFIAVGCSSNDDSVTKISGCTDPESTNYNANANTDDGSCVYEKNATISFTQNWDGKAITKNDITEKTIYKNEAGNFLEISKLRYLISRIVLHKADGTNISFNEYQLIDLSDDGTKTLSPALPITTGDYTGISFIYGFNEADNKSGAYPDLNDANWNWPSGLGGGYHFMQMEGTFDDNNGARKPYAYHNGTARKSPGVFEQNFISFNFDMDFTITADATIEIKMDVSEWYKNPLTWDLNDRSVELMMDYLAQKDMNRNGQTVFSIGAITQ